MTERSLNDEIRELAEEVAVDPMNKPIGVRRTY